MKKKLTLVSILILFIVVITKTKEKVDNEVNHPIWIEMMEEPNVNMDKARKAFDTYWENNTHYKGDKSKNFERWYTINSNRLDQFGNVISAAQVKSEFQRMKINAAVSQKGKWFNYGPINVGARNNGDKRDGGRVKDVEFHPTDANTYYVSCFKSGLFKTIDAGSSWVPLTDQLTEEIYISKVLKSNPNTIYIGTNLGVLKTLDGGINWNATGLSSGKTNALILKPDNDNIVIAGNDSGIYRSTNGGQTFNNVKSASKVEELRVHPTNSDIMYASTNGATSQFFRSVDGGVTWSENTTFGQGAFMKIAVTPAQPNYVYVINSRDHLDQDSFEGFYVSTDSGISFTKKSSVTPCITGYDNNGNISRGQPNYNLFVTVDPDDENLIYAGGVKSWKSTDGGFNWTQIFNNVTSIGFGLHLDQLTWAHSPVTKKLFAVNDGGVYFLNTDNKFQPITDGLPIAEVFECTQSQQTATNVAGGTMHCGIKVNKNGTWFTPWGGDEATCLYDYSDDNYMYHFKYGKISRSNNGGFSFQRIKADESNGEYTGTGVLDKSDVNTLFIGLYEVERINNARTATSTQVWSKISSFGGSTKIKKIEQSDANHNVLFVSRGGKFYRSDNVREVSPSFTELTLPSSGTVNDIAAHPTNTDIVYILLGSKIYKSINKGNTWTDISNGLPSVSLLEMIYDKTTDEGIYVGTDIGVYYKDTTLSNWIDYSEGLPAIRVSGMDIYYGDTRDDSFLTISTDGRGFWRSELNDVVAKTPVVGFNSDKSEVFTEEAVNFTNTSTDIQVGSFIWAFEGGNPSTSIDENPKVIYNTTGTYPVSLTYITNSGTVTKTINDYISVTQLPEPVASFTVNNQNIFEGNIAAFSDTSINNPKSWEWTFEGGIPAISTIQNPTITYNEIGTFKVTLKVKNSAGTDTKEEVNYIVVTANSGSGSLQGHYNFQNNLFDESSYQRDLAIIGNYTPTFVTDKDGNPNSAFEASSEIAKYLTNGYKGIGGNGERTVTAWIKTTSGSMGTRKTIVSWGTNSGGQMFNVMVDDGNIRVEGGTCNVQNDDSTVARLDGNTWHHIAVVFNPSDGDKLKDVKLYIDGVYYLNQTDSGDSYNSEGTVINTNNTINNIQIGNSNYNDGYFWQGALDDVRIYSEALSIDKIIEIKNSSISAPPVADFEANNTSIFYGDEIQFTDVSSNSPNSWLWTFEGGDPASSTDQNTLVTYPNNGVYKATLQVSNEHGTDTKEKIDYISVTPPPPPVANFEASNTDIKEGDTVLFTDTSTGSPKNWEWTFEGGIANDTTIANPEVTYSSEGNYKVTLKVTNQKGSDIKEMMSYINVTKHLIDLLPNNNYALSVQSETCRNSNNGIINIAVLEDYNYTGLITGNGFNKSIDFNLSNPLVLENLSAGTYNICITVSSFPEYEQCFTVVVNEPKDLAIQSKINTSKKTVTLKLDGANNYKILLNEKEYTTSQSKITLELDDRINNVLKVSTDKWCQGIYEEIIILNGEEIFYPNPASNTLNVFVSPVSKSAKVVDIKINNLNGQQLVSKKLTVLNGRIALDIGHLPKGVYIVLAEVEGEYLNHKIIKQ